MDDNEFFGYFKKVEEALKARGASPRIMAQFEKLMQVTTEIETESKNMSAIEKDFRFHMDYKERFDAAFDELWKITEEEGICLPR